MKIDDFSPSLQTFGRRGATITPGATDLDPVAKTVVCLTAGNITVVPVDNDNADTIAFTDVPSGFAVPFIVRRVTAATATVAAIYD